MAHPAGVHSTSRAVQSPRDESARDFPSGPGMTAAALAMAAAPGLLGQASRRRGACSRSRPRSSAAGRRRHARVAADAARRRAVPEDDGRHLSPGRRHRGDDRDQRQRARHPRRSWDEGVEPGLTLVSRVATADYAVNLKAPTVHRRRTFVARAVPEADPADSDRRHRQDDGERHHQGRAAPTSRRRAPSTTGSSTTRFAIRRRAAAASATSASCSNPETSAASAPT